MLTIRGKTVVVRPLTLTEVGQVIDSVEVLGTCTPTIKVMEPDKLPHLLRVIAFSIRREFPGATIEELMDDLKDAVDVANIGPVLRALSSGQYPNQIHQETGHV